MNYKSQNKIDMIKGFLQLFNLKIKEEDINKPKITVIDNHNKKVGNIITDDKEIIVKAEFEGNTLISKCKKEVSNKNDNIDFIYFYLKNNNTTTNGRMQINNNKLQNTTLITNNEDKKIIVKIMRNTNLFNIKIKKETEKEEIEIRPQEGLIFHNITKGKYDIGKESFPYRYYATVFDQEHNSEISLFLREEEYKKTTNYINERIQKTFKTNSKDDLIQKGLLIKQIDLKYTQTLNNIKKLYQYNNKNLIDSLIELSYDYPKEVKQALLETNNDNIKQKTKKLQKA